MNTIPTSCQSCGQTFRTEDNIMAMGSTAYHEECYAQLMKSVMGIPAHHFTEQQIREIVRDEFAKLGAK